jgi:mitochondrial fission protein ELM1
MGDRAGDNSQIQGLAEALGWPLEIKRFVYKRYERLVSFPFTTTLAGVVEEESSHMEAPWPDLVISAGRRNEPIARYIQKQSPGPVKLVHVGRPWARIDRFDLVVTTPQYRLPDLPNVLQNETPLHRVDLARLAEERPRWLPRLAHLPGPYLVILAGGSSGPYPFDAPSGTRLGRMANELARDMGASVLVTTSARTPDDTANALESELTVPHEIFRWTPGATENPYFGYLAVADAIVVTADSMSMMAEACTASCPVYLYDTGVGVTAMHDWAIPIDAPPPKRLSRRYLRALIYRAGMKVGPIRWTRDIRIVQQRLIDTGRAGWLGEGRAPENPPPLRDLERAVARVRALFEPPARVEPAPAPPAATDPARSLQA